MSALNRQTNRQTIRVWDAPTRLFHWLLVLCFAGAYITAEGERWRLVHVTLGYTMGGLLAFRMVWGLVGTRYARFGNFVRGPRAVVAYLRALRSASPPHFTGHNPAGAVAIVLLIVTGLVIVGTGWASYNDVGGEWLSALHEVAGNTMLAIVGVHIAGVVVATYLHRENLVRAMVTGTKQGLPRDGVPPTWWSAAVALVITLCVLVFWWLQWQSAP
jgi:cytochrome b